MVGVLFTKVKSVVKFVQNWNLNPPPPSLQQLNTGEYKKSLPAGWHLPFQIQQWNRQNV